LSNSFKPAAALGAVVWDNKDIAQALSYGIYKYKNRKKTG